MKKRVLIMLLAGIFFSCATDTIKKRTADTTEVVPLPDGSIALLNANSAISFDSKFEPRKVVQEGEIFYVVAEGESLFTVKTENGAVEVLGTEFHVNSDGETLEVEVEKGTVRILFEDIRKVIEKGQKAIARDVKKGIEVGKAEFKHKHWVKKMKREFRKTAKAVKKESKKLEKETKKILKNLKE